MLLLFYIYNPPFVILWYLFQAGKNNPNQIIHPWNIPNATWSEQCHTFKERGAAEQRRPKWIDFLCPVEKHSIKKIQVLVEKAERESAWTKWNG